MLMRLLAWRLQAKNVTLTSLFRVKIDCRVFWTLVRRHKSRMEAWYVFLLLFLHWSAWPCLANGWNFHFFFFFRWTTPLNRDRSELRCTKTPPLLSSAVSELMLSDSVCLTVSSLHKGYPEESDRMVAEENHFCGYCITHIWSMPHVPRG